MRFKFTICHGCNRYSVLCDMDPQPCEGCDCWRDEYYGAWWFERYSEVFG